MPCDIYLSEHDGCRASSRSGGRTPLFVSQLLPSDGHSTFHSRWVSDEPGKIAERFFDLAQEMVGHIRGGLAQVNVLVSMMFASVSGTASADTAGVGSMIIPAMVKRGTHPASLLRSRQPHRLWVQ